MKHALATMLLLVILLPAGGWVDAQLFCWKGAALIDAQGYTEIAYTCVYR